MEQWSKKLLTPQFVTKVKEIKWDSSSEEDSSTLCTMNRYQFKGIKDDKPTI